METVLWFLVIDVPGSFCALDDRRRRNTCVDAETARLPRPPEEEHVCG
jgi:hypothetical protein